MLPNPSSFPYLDFIAAPFDEIGRYKLGIFRQSSQKDHPGTKSKLEMAALFRERLSSHPPALLVDSIDLPDLEQLWPIDGSTKRLTTGRHWADSEASLLITTEMYKGFNEYLSSLKECPIDTMGDLVAWNEANPVSLCI